MLRGPRQPAGAALSEDRKLGVAFALAAVSYGMSRTVGLPLAREHTAPFDALGVVTQVVQAVGLVAALRLCEQAAAVRRLVTRKDSR
jgi:hypothetical protein